MNVVGLQIPGGSVAIGYSRTRLILLGKHAMVCFDLSEITGIWLALPTIIQIEIGVDPVVSVHWKDRAKGGIREFAGGLASERSARLTAARV